MTADHRLLGNRPRRFIIAGLSLSVVAMSIALATGTFAEDGPSGPEKSASEPAQPTYPSDADRVAAEREAPQRIAERTKSLVEEFLASGRSLDSLPRVRGGESNVTRSPLVKDVIERSGAGAVLAVVSEQKLVGDSTVVSTLSVSEVLDGAFSGGTVAVAQTGGPREGPDGLILLESPTDPVLRTGHTYLLFLRIPTPAAVAAAGLSDSVYALGGEGTSFEVVDGVLHALVQSEEQRSEIDGSPLAAAKTAIAAAVKAR